MDLLIWCVEEIRDLAVGLERSGLVVGLGREKPGFNKPTYGQRKRGQVGLGLDVARPNKATTTRLESQGSPCVPLFWASARRAKWWKCQSRNPARVENPRPSTSGSLASSPKKSVGAL